MLYGLALSSPVLALHAQNVQLVNVLANDLAYNAARREIYATVPSVVGFPYGNSVVTIDPTSGAILRSSFAGSEPTRIVVSDDGSRAYVGINGARSFRSWAPATDTFGALLPLVTRFGRPAVAEDLAVAPGQPGIVLVSRDEVGSTASGDLELYRNDVSQGARGTFSLSANQTVFIDGSTLVTYNSASTGFDLARWAFDSNTLTLLQQATISGLISGFGTQIEAASGLIYATNGMVVDPRSLSALGTFNTGLSNAGVESVSAFNATYFLGRAASTGSAVLKFFDNSTFLQLASFDLGISMGSSSVLDLTYVDNGSLAFLFSDGRMGLISGLSPVPLPGTALLLATGLACLVFWPKRSARSGTFSGQSALA